MEKKYEKINAKVALIAFLCMKFKEFYEQKARESNKKYKKSYKKYVCVRTYTSIEIFREEIQEEILDEPSIDVTCTEVTEGEYIGNILTNKGLSEGNSTEKVEKIQKTKTIIHSFINKVIEYYNKNKKLRLILEAFTGICGALQMVEALSRYLQSRGIFSAFYLLIFFYSFANTLKILTDFLNVESAHFSEREILLLTKLFFSLLGVIMLQWLLKTTFIRKFTLSLLCFFKKA